jgi:hypothetical protein
VTPDLTCREFVDFATEYLDRALEPHERVRCEQHLVVCSGCSHYLEELQATIRLTRTLGAQDELGDAGRRRLIAALDEWRASKP